MPILGPKTITGAIITWMAKVKPYQSTLTWLGVHLAWKVRPYMLGIALGSIAAEQTF